MLTNPRRTDQKFVVYIDMLDYLGVKGHAQKIVFHLLEDMLNRGIMSIWTINSFDLARKLLKKKLHCTGPLRSSRIKTPKIVTSSKLKAKLWRSMPKEE
ncbi:hypothetical protein NQ314_001007 [Rhamnusium bicolor]|uniref:PiggyBac transposable element-derived protein domain-containing protein n=1 Tax=Rhamnusium bicolor TaxID=1586634 RepID=A0AAV8ZUU4_9CUCU|nr:hypothetical protein NQ314_001007 [Rhamnusium bicolor]